MQALCMTRQVGPGKHIRAARERSGVSQGDLAAAAVVSRASLNEWEGGRDNLTAENVLRVSKALGVSPLYVLTGREEIPRQGLPDLPTYLRASLALPDDAVQVIERTTEAFAAEQRLVEIEDSALRRRRLADVRVLGLPPQDEAASQHPRDEDDHR